MKVRVCGESIDVASWQRNIQSCDGEHKYCGQTVPLAFALGTIHQQSEVLKKIDVHRV